MPSPTQCPYCEARNCETHHWLMNQVGCTECAGALSTWLSCLLTCNIQPKVPLCMCPGSGYHMLSLETPVQHTNKRPAQERTGVPSGLQAASDFYRGTDSHAKKEQPFWEWKCPRCSNRSKGHPVTRGNTPGTTLCGKPQASC